MIDVETFKTAADTWVKQTLGGGFAMFWRNQGQPVEQTYVNLWPLSLRSLSAVDAPDSAYDADADLMRLTTVGPRLLRLQVDLYTDARLAPNDALSLGTKLYDSLRAEKAKDLFFASGISIPQLDDTIHNLAILESDQWVGRHSFEACFQLQSTHVEWVDFFTSVEIDSDVLEIDPALVQVLLLE
jgi:hypothetical protein